MSIVIFIFSSVKFRYSLQNIFIVCSCTVQLTATEEKNVLDFLSKIFSSGCLSVFESGVKELFCLSLSWKCVRKYDMHWPPSKMKRWVWYENFRGKLVKGQKILILDGQRGDCVIRGVILQGKPSNLTIFELHFKKQLLYYALKGSMYTKE